MIDKQHLFEARTGGYRTYRIPGILCTPNDIVMVTTEARLGRGGDWDPIDILMRRSEDGGRTWGDPRVLVDHNQFGKGPMNNCSLIHDRFTNRVHSLFCHNYADVYHMHSDDQGLNWSQPRNITASFSRLREVYPWRVIAMGPGHGIQLRSGRLLLPFWMSTGASSEFPGQLGHRPSEVCSVFSDDNGTSWQTGNVVVHTDDEFVHPSESIAVELSDGRVLFNIRSESDQHRRLVCESPDGAEGWSHPRFDDALIEPVCMASIIALNMPGSPGMIAFANPNSVSTSMLKRKSFLRNRQDLTVRLSLDDCCTWPYHKLLQQGPAGYSDLAVCSDGTLLCAYENQQVNGMFDDRFLTVARFDVDWIMTDQTSVSEGPE
jgi:sialidase-1